MPRSKAVVNGIISISAEVSEFLSEVNFSEFLPNMTEISEFLSNEARFLDFLFNPVGFITA